MKTSTKKNVNLFVNLCVQLGLKRVIVSPGSRNAPLSIAFNQHPEIQCSVVPDERSAGFVALGKALQRQEPVALLCTSGSAAANYYPSITEAYYQGIPLIVITADRPQAWINEGDGQTIIQDKLFHNHVRYEVQLADAPENEEYAWYLRKETCKAFEKSRFLDPGPVHVNFALTEPLYGTIELDAQPIRKFSLELPESWLSVEQKQSIQQTWQSSYKKMILCGQMAPDPALKTLLRKLAQDPSVLILVENLSNLQDEQFVHCIDRSLNAISEDEMEQFAPDLLVTLGSAIVSKRIKAFLRKHPAREHWKIGSAFPMMDTYQQLTHSFPMKPEAFFVQCELKSKHHSTYGEEWKTRDLSIQQAASEWFSKHAPWCDLFVFSIIMKRLPEHSILHLSNSSVVRYAQLFDPEKEVVYQSNRGASGIDGSSSTALGAASEDPDHWHTLITGDMSFFYDSNAFWNHIKVPNLRIILINNGGGGIFKIIPGPDTTEELNDFFVFDNQFEAQPICMSFGINYCKVQNSEELHQQLDVFYQREENGCPKLLEVDTRNLPNEKYLSEFFEKMKTAHH